MTITDDIQEAYRRLRRLVMDYLGINIPTPPMSEQGETTESHGTTEPTVAGQNGGSAALGRAWSKASIADSLTLSQAHTWTIKAQSPILSGRGIVVSYKGMEEMVQIWYTYIQVLKCTT